MYEILPLIIAKENMIKLLSFASDEEEAEEIMSFLSPKGDVIRLQENAEMVQALLFYASANYNTQFDESVRIWLKKLNTVANYADAVLEEFNYQTLRLKLEINGLMNKVCRLFSASKNSLLFRLKITSINKSLDEIYKQGIQIGLIRLPGAKSLDANVRESQIRLPYPYVDDLEVLGREAEVSRIVKRLCFSGNEKHLPVVAMVGEGGLGKTTLARLVCNHEKVVKYFDEIIWITVSDDFDITRLLNEMVQSLTGKNPWLSNVNEIVKNELGGRLKGKRYLLILDDVCNDDEDKLGYLRKALLGIVTSHGSKIMVTTCMQQFVSIMPFYNIFYLKGLFLDESLSMFKQRAFAEGGPTETHNMVDIGRDIVRSCNGLPLAIKALGGIMYVL
ncbi:hypothetical protein LguiA_029611 [Lonicera macranthoides]